MRNVSFLSSPNSHESPYCLGERSEALRLRKVIIYVKIEPNSPLVEKFGRVDYVDLSSGVTADSIKHLFVSIQNRLFDARNEPRKVEGARTPLPEPKEKKLREADAILAAQKNDSETQEKIANRGNLVSVTLGLLAFLAVNHWSNTRSFQPSN